MRTQALAAVGAAWTAVFGVGYLLLVRSQDSDPAPAVPVLLGIAVLAGVVAAVGIRRRPALVVALTASGITMIIGLLSVGIVLAPAVISFAVALARAARTPSPAQKAARIAAMS